MTAPLSDLRRSDRRFELAEDKDTTIVALQDEIDSLRRKLGIAIDQAQQIMNDAQLSQVCPLNMFVTDVLERLDDNI